MTISSSTIKRLAQVSLFQNLGPAELEELALMCTRKKFDPDAKLTFIEGEENSFCIINQGKAIVKTPDASGQGNVIGYLEPGEYFGEVTAIDSEPRPFEVFASDKEVEVLAFTQKDFLEVLQNYPSIHLALSREFCGRLRALKNLTSNIPLPASVRVARVLLSIANKQGTVTNDGIVLPQLTQSEVAKLSDSSKDVIAEAFKELNKEKLIMPTESRQVLIPNKQKIEDWVKFRTERRRQQAH